VNDVTQGTQADNQNLTVRGFAYVEHDRSSSEPQCAIPADSFHRLENTPAGGEDHPAPQFKT
jgi:hypothetical protein